MKNSERYIGAYALTMHLAKKNAKRPLQYDDVLAIIAKEKPVDAVVVTDKKLLKAVKALMKQYEQSSQAEYVHDPIAHALYHTWKQMDERRNTNE